MNDQSARESVYTEALTEQLQTIWGAGFLSPGGPAEVARMLAGVDLAGAEVLDFGCGVGGPSLDLIATHGASRVLGVDIEPGVLDRARRSAAEAGLSDRAGFQLVRPGPLPLEPESFDVVFSKDVFVTMEGKRPVYAEIFRVLRPGGRLVASDWLRRDGPVSPLMRRWMLFSTGLTGLKSAAETAPMLAGAGFANVEVIDRSAWYGEQARRDLAGMQGPLWPRLVEARGEESARGAVEFWRLMLEVLDSGDLRPSHLRAHKPPGGLTNG